MASNATRGTSASAINNRKSSRSAIKVKARLLVSKGVSFQVDVLDLSATGFRIETANYIPLARRVYLTLPGFQALSATVVWNERELYGCEFSHPLYSSVFAHLSDSFPALIQ
jgi:hypothetical protein